MLVNYRDEDFINDDLSYLIEKKISYTFQYMRTIYE